MDLKDIIRSFFGLRGPPGTYEEFPEDGGGFEDFGPGFNHPGGATEEWDDDDDALGDRNDNFFNFESETQDMFKHFEEMFRNFGLSDFHSINIPGIEATPNRRRLSPRDEMLKQPDELEEKVQGHSDKSSNKESQIRFGDVFRSPWHWNIPTMPTSPNKEDRDLDEHVKDGKLHELLKPRQQPEQGIKSFSKSVSIQTIRKPDGTFEQRRTERDSDGNVKTTVTTSQDDQNEVLKPFVPSGRWSDYQAQNEEHSQRQSLFDKFFGSWFR